MAKRLNDIDPDGLRIVIPWGELRVGSSFFIPCINTESCERQVQTVAKRLGIVLASRTRIEGPYMGLRFWRTA